MRESIHSGLVTRIRSADSIYLTKMITRFFMFRAVGFREVKEQAHKPGDADTRNGTYSVKHAQHD